MPLFRSPKVEVTAVALRAPKQLIERIDRLVARHNKEKKEASVSRNQAILQLLEGAVGEAEMEAVKPR